MKKITLITILLATFGTKSFAHCPIPQWCPSAPLHQTLCPGEQIEDIEFPSVIGKTLIINWWLDGTRFSSIDTPDGITVSGPPDNREHSAPVSIKGAPTTPGTHHYTVSNTCGVELLHGSITVNTTPPTIGMVTPTIDQTTPQNIAFDSVLTLTAEPAGIPPITIQWYSSTTPSSAAGASGTAVSGATGNTLAPPTNVVNTAGIYYYAIATDRCGSATATINTSDKHIVLPTTGCDFVTASRNNVTITSSSFASTERTISAANGKAQQIWSGPVTSPQCTPRGDSYNGGANPNFNVDCRASTNGSGVHYFSWCAVMKYANILCPSPWRVPTRQDFINLDILLGGDGENRSVGSGENGFTGTGTNQKYTGTVAGNWGGSRFTARASDLSIAYSSYWSSSEDTASIAFYLTYTASNVYPQRNIVNKDYGFVLRCVRDN